MVRFFKSLFLNTNLFYALAILSVLFLFSYWFTFLFLWTSLLLFAISLTVLLDILLLYKPNEAILAVRKLPEKFSNSDPNPVPVQVTNNYRLRMDLVIIDEIPVQFQKRDFIKTMQLAPNETKTFTYELTPRQRGEYIFGYLHLYVSSPIGLITRRYSFDQNQSVKVYPSFIQMKQYDFLSIDHRKTNFGLKKIRRLGHTMEFEQIKEYIPGDDVRTINWKATAKKGALMVNQFQDEKSQPLYSIIDVGRVMKMPFNGLSLLDYAINSTLAFSNIALKKQDKVGLLTFSNQIHQSLPASSKKSYLLSISDMLYNVNTKFLDSDFGLLYGVIKRKITHRSLLLLYTNFEHISSLKRQLPYLKGLSQQHVLVVIFFDNTELKQLLDKEAQNLSGIYQKTIAQKFDYDKRLMVKELEKHGIQTILTAPENLTVNTINKYLEIKSRGIL
ncbi:DUF58 domain-containing protein [Pararhodonellum marinum]|uniref:DUF58 domain-containing protein n=1 Tax=Pararhodonellum marinum TaxID=2755358 RepID=UPI00188F2B59|nr:DUF58 domain-containing protein [Pararhodonellum marinum]